MGRKSSVTSSIRKIYKIDIRKDQDFIIFEIEGNSFLRHMVRIIVGTLLFVGIGNINKDSIEEIILSKNRENAGPTAPAKGLYLEEVFY